jgi:hypothetical protein
MSEEKAPYRTKADIIPIGGVTKLDIPVDRVLEQAKGELSGVVVLGFDKEGKFYGASSYADGGTVLWLLESCKKMLLESGE